MHNSVPLHTLVRFLNKKLNTRGIPDISKNGLQVSGKKQIQCVGFCVDACLKTFELAKRAKADLIISHHGLIWKAKKDLTGLKNKRINFLKRNKINFYASHLPLDVNFKYGNNIQIANMLELTDLKKFGSYHGLKIGYYGRLSTTCSIKNLTTLIEKKLKTKCICLNFGKKKISTIGIVSGGGSFSLAEASRKNIDCLITGETSHQIYHEAEDLKQNLIFAGHYATETAGLKALMLLIKKEFKLKTVFIDSPTGL